MLERSDTRFGAVAVLLSLFSGSAVSGAEDAVPAGISLHERGYGWQIVDTKGMALYTFVRDTEAGKSACYGPCAEQWPALAANDGDAASGDWSSFQREDGIRQWSYRGQPLYAYRRDLAVGDSYGDGVNDQWALATKPIETPAGVSISLTLLGHTLADRKGITLYAMAGAADCAGDCIKTWIPMVAPWAAAGQGDWTVVARADGLRQWAFRGRPLYRYAADIKPRETAGQGIDGKWQAVVLEPPPPLPGWVKVIGGDAGPILGDAEGKTLYARVPPRPRARRPPQQAGQTAQPVQVAKAPPTAEGGGVVHPDPQTAAAPGAQVAGQVVGAAPESETEKKCGIECAGSDWRPVLAKPDDKQIGNWAHVTRPDGQLHWAYKGDLLYTNVRDKMPGDLNGIRSGAGRNMRTLTPTGEQMPGTGA